VAKDTPPENAVQVENEEGLGPWGNER